MCISRNGHIVETCRGLENGLYDADIKPIMDESSAYAVIGSSHTDSVIDDTSNCAKSQNRFQLWHARLGHPGKTMFSRMVTAVQHLDLQKQDINRSPDMQIPCIACAQGKFSRKPAKFKEPYNSNTFLSQLNVDILGPIHPPSGPFRYVMGIVDSSSRWSYAALLSHKSQVYPRILSQYLKLRTSYSECPIKKVRVDNASEFTSATLQRFFESQGIALETSTPYTPNQNGAAESLMKRIQTVARPMLLATNLLASAWGHAVLHANTLLNFRPSSYLTESPYQLLNGSIPSVSHLRTFGCAVYVPIFDEKSKGKFGPRRKLGTYVGYESPSKIRYLDPPTGDLFRARFQDCTTSFGP